MKNILVTGASSAPAQLSSFRRRTTTWVAIARALANDPQVILADEPTGNLDTNNSQRAFELLANIVREREKALLLVTHNRFTADACDWVHEMKDGLLIASHPHGQRISV
jgi:ABC-type lipoprotein export system ATPase subunit